MEYAVAIQVIKELNVVTVQTNTIKTNLNANHAVVTRTGSIMENVMLMVHAIAKVTLRERNVTLWKMVITKEEVEQKVKPWLAIVIKLDLEIVKLMVHVNASLGIKEQDVIHAMDQNINMTLIDNVQVRFFQIP